MKTLLCRDSGFDCEAEIRAGSDEEVLSQAAEHAQTKHNLQVTPELADKLKTLIKEEN